MNVLRRLILLTCAVAVVGCAETRTNGTTVSVEQSDSATTSQDMLVETSDVKNPVAEGEESSNSVDASSESVAAERSPNAEENKARNQETLKSDVSKTQPTFNKLMTAAHHAIEQKHWKEAHRLLEDSLQIDPSSTAAQDLLVFVARQQNLLHQQDLAERFTAAIQAERWTEANQIAQKMNTQSSEVLEQIRRSETLIDAEKRADRLLSKPERLSRPSTQTEVTFLRNLTDSVDLGNRIGEKLTRLTEMSRRWNTPVVINLNSDGYTNVILRPGRNLGRFHAQTFQLMPGEYELIGRRDGFREVRQALRLDPNDEPKTVEIKASERF